MLKEENLILFLSHYEIASYLSNLSVSLLCFVLLRYLIKAETASEDLNPWAKYLGYAFLFLFLQYFFKWIGLGDVFANISFIGKKNSAIVFSELFGVTINLFTLMTANLIQKKKKLISNWFIFLVGADFVAVFLACFYNLDTAYSANAMETICRLIGDTISFLCIVYLGYATYINTGFYAPFYNSSSNAGLHKSKPPKLSSTRDLLLLFWVLLYALIHLISPVIPLIAEFFIPTNLDQQQLAIRSSGLFLSLLAVPLKVILFIFAFGIITLENKTLISFRRTLRKSVEKRKVFFSSDSILKTIYKIFDAKTVKLFIIVPVEGENNSIQKKAHLFEYYDGKIKSLSDYETVEIDGENTIIGRLLNEKNESLEFDGTKPIKYHGGLIGCLQIEKKETRKFTHSAERILQILAWDISPLLQSYRLQESLLLLTNKLKLSLKKTNDASSQNTKLNLKSDADLREEIEENIKQILSPVSLKSDINSMFVKKTLRNPPKKSPLKNGNFTGDSVKNAVMKYECFVDEEDAGFAIHKASSEDSFDREKEGYSIGVLSLEFDKDKDPYNKPSLGYYYGYGNSVASIVTTCYLNSIGKKLNSIIRNLSLELSERRTFNTWIKAVVANVKSAEGIDELLVFHPIHKKYWITSEVSEKEQQVFLEKTQLPDTEEILAMLENGKPQVIRASENYLVVGKKIPLEDLKEFSSSFFLFGISREKIPNGLEPSEVKFNAEWKKFFDSLAGIAGNSLTRIIQAHEIEKNQTDRSVIETALKMGLLTHQIMNNIENLYNSRKLLNDKISELTIEPFAKESIVKSIRDFENTIDDLKNLAKGMRFASEKSDRSGNCFLYDAVNKIVESYSNTYDDQIRKIKIINRIKGNKDEIGENKTKINLPCFVLEMVFNNLIENAITAIKVGKNFSDPKIEIWAEDSAEEEGYIDCFVSDNGFGIEESIRETIFEPQVSTKSDSGGFGLFLVKKTLERNAASIEISSPPDSKNTVFRLQLPKVDD